MVGSNVQVVPCPPESRLEALERLYQGLSGPFRAELIASILADDQRGRVDLSGLWIAQRTGWTGNRLVGAMLTQKLAGRAAAVWPPEVRPSWNRRAIAATLVQTALESLRADGTVIVQAILDATADPHSALDLTRGGMPHVTDLIFMKRDAAAPWTIPSRDEAPQLQWRGLDETGEALFRQTLAATYRGSLDMPELEGARSLADVIAGHRAAGEFVPKLWRLGTIADRPEPVAALIVAPVPDRRAWEIVYLGLVAEARGRGLGAETLAHARDLALADGEADALELAADARNAPALRLYRRAGFAPRDRRRVHLAVLRPPANFGPPPSTREATNP